MSIFDGYPGFSGLGPYSALESGVMRGAEKLVGYMFGPPLTKAEIRRRMSRTVIPNVAQGVTTA
jgi:hypothetical protein